MEIMILKYLLYLVVFHNILLGPTLFILYINDLCNVLKILKFIVI